MDNNTEIGIEQAARRFFRLAETAAKYGGFWVSAAGGTARVVAGVFARHFGVDFEDALSVLRDAGREWAGREDWYAEMAYMQPHKWDAWHDEVPGRFDARTIARAACKVTADPLNSGLA